VLLQPGPEFFNKIRPFQAVQPSAAASLKRTLQ
jgi:hypothetical protein